MANQRETYLQNARLADAAYAYLDKNMTDKEIIDALKERNFIQDDAQSFVDKYRIVDTLNDTVSGAQAVIFEG